MNVYTSHRSLYLKKKKAKAVSVVGSFLCEYPPLQPNSFRKWIPQQDFGNWLNNKKPNNEWLSHTCIVVFWSYEGSVQKKMGENCWHIKIQSTAQVEQNQRQPSDKQTKIALTKTSCEDYNSKHWENQRLLLRIK